MVQLSESKSDYSVIWKITLTRGAGVGGLSLQNIILTLFSPPLLPPTSVIPATSAKRFKKVVGKETYSETLESTPSMEKEKFPQDYFPEVGHAGS